MMALSKIEPPLEEYSWVLCNLLGNTLKRQAITIVLTFIINRDKSNGVKLGGQGDCRNFGQKVDNAKAKGERKKARGASMTLKLPRSGRPIRERVVR
jgi:hypothetical protein